MFAGAVHRHQTDAPPGLKAWNCSPGSLVAPTFDPVAVAMVPLMGVPACRASFAGAAESVETRAENKKKIPPKQRAKDFMAIRQGLIRRDYKRVGRRVMSEILRRFTFFAGRRPIVIRWETVLRWET